MSVSLSVEEVENNGRNGAGTDGEGEGEGDNHVVDGYDDGSESESINSEEEDEEETEDCERHPCLKKILTISLHSFFMEEILILSKEL